jgi:uncharacterized protein (TIGR03083 family)
VDVPQLVKQEMDDIAAFLSTLTPEQWEADTLCAGWKVRDVAGHLTGGYRATTTIPRTLPKVIASGFSFNRFLKKDATTTAKRLDRTALIEHIRGADMSLGIGKFVKPADRLTDHVTHHLDILVPLGIAPTISAERLRVVLDNSVTRKGKPVKKTAGLSFAATDLDWTWGSGPEVRGPATSIILALQGRPRGLDDLTGDGVATLRSRM